MTPPDAEWAAAFRRSAKSCWARYCDSGHDPGRITTASIADDVADLRRALGHPTWSLWATSFGTRVALTVMRDHPEGVRSAILDGVLPPEVDSLGYAANTGLAFDALVRACRDDEDCNAAYPDLERRFEALAARLDAQPRMIQLDIPDMPVVTARLDGWTLRDIAYRMLADGPQARFLPLLVKEAEAGDQRRLERMKSWTFLLSLIEAESIADDVKASVFCADLIPAGPDWVEQARAADRRFADQVWDPGQTGYCGAWPVARSPTADAAPMTGAIPTLLISGAFDPLTPSAWAEATAEWLPKGYSYVFPGSGHGVLMSGQACARRITARFLDDPSQRPDHDCFARLAPMIFEPPPR